jgi:hypothetical protein
MRNAVRQVVLGRKRLLLDNFPAAAAYSLRRLNSSYSGFCIRVRRSSDNAEINIGFHQDELDANTLLGFVGAGNGHVVTQYDQSGNSRNKTQTTASKQPQIVTGGVLNMSGIRPTIAFDGVDDVFTTTNLREALAIPAGGGGLTYFSVANTVSYGSRDGRFNTHGVGDMISNGDYAFGGTNIGTAWQVNATGADGSGIFLNGIKSPINRLNTQTVRGSWDGSTGINLRIWDNGASVNNLSGTLASPPVSGLTCSRDPIVGARSEVDAFCQLLDSELIVSNSAVDDATRQAIEQNQIVYYSIP